MKTLRRTRHTAFQTYTGNSHVAPVPVENCHIHSPGYL